MARDRGAQSPDLSSYPAGLLADRIPRAAVFGIGLTFFAIGYLGLGLTDDPLTAWLLIGAYGLFTGCTDGVGKAWISSLVGSDVQSSAQGVFQGATGFAVMAAGLWAGLAWGADGAIPLLISGSVGAVFAVALLTSALFGRRHSNGGVSTPTTP